MAVYIAPNNRKVSPVNRENFTDQVVISGVNQNYLVEKGIFFLEYLEAKVNTTVQITDGEDNVIVTAISGFSQDHSPLRCDYGIKITGEVGIVKGFVMRNVFDE